MKRLSISIISAILITFMGCEKSIIVDLGPTESQLSVECILVPNRLPKLYLGMTVDYFDTTASHTNIFVDDAIVTLTSSQGIDTLGISSEYNPFYCREDFFYLGTTVISQGLHYHLTIDHGGRTYEADTDMNVAVIEIDSVGFVPNFSDIYGEHEGIVVNFTDNPASTNYYRYFMERVLDVDHEDIVDCATEPFNAVEIGRTVFFDTNIGGASLTIVIEPVFKHAEGDSALVFLQTLDAASARFFDDLDQQKNSKLNPFIEPVFITSNIANAFGIFGASNISTPINFIYPAER